MEGLWGLLGPESLPNARRTRTLGLGASVRRYNDLAVPGLVGVWYGKQLLLATLGVAVDEAEWQSSDEFELLYAQHAGALQHGLACSINALQAAKHTCVETFIPLALINISPLKLNVCAWINFFQIL